TLDASSVLELVADSLKAVVAYDSLTIYRVDLARQVRYPVIARDRFAEIILEYEAPLGQGITGWAVEHREAVLANDAILDPRSVQIPGTPIEPESLIVVPLIVQGDVLGTLNVARIGEQESHFSENEFELTKLFAAQAAIALRNAETHGEVKVQAERDALTGLRNHGAFQRELSLTIATAEAHPMAVLMMDLDRFKAYNDLQGHPAGDALLAAVAHTIESAIRSTDSAYRYGGDEFTAILPVTDRAGATEVANRIRTMVDALSDAHPGPSVSISIGIACLPDDGLEKDALMETADAALYLAKGSRLRSSMRDPLVAALDDTAGVLLHGGTTDDLLHSVLARAARLLGTPNAYLSMVESTGLHLRMRAGIGLYEPVVGHVISVNVGVAGMVCRTGRPFTVDDYSRYEDRAMNLADVDIGAVLGVPLLSHGKVMGMIGVASGTKDRTWGEADIDALSRFAKLASIALENARLQEAALRGPTDPVTGLPTRERLVEAINAALEEPTGGTTLLTPASVLLLDIDRFKVLNESLGHQAGDQVLAEVGRRIATVLRDGDLVARFGGDEFGILLSPADDERATAVSDQILAALKAPIDLDARMWFISASVGYVTGLPGKATAGGLLREAEVALVQAQAEPTKRVARFDAVRSHAALERLDLEADLQAAIEMDELLVHYQPIVDLRTERIVGFEALVRWEHPARGLISPADFIPLAEETDLIIPLGAVVLAKACRQARALRDRWPGERLMMSVNLSPRQFADSELVPSIAAILAETGLEASSLELEITETAVMDRSDAGIAALAALRELGVHLVLDDFGTGYSSLAHLRHLPLDTIKVDRSFISELNEGDANVAIVQAVLSLAHGLGITVVAEGIEQATQADRLRELGCDLGQGYLWSRPVAPRQLDELMAVAVAQRRLPKSRSRNRNRLTKSR
ncbi:MAG: EAL domain-containing protein, partial [Chloroflexota bacterium]